MTKPLVSILIAVYNAGEYLRPSVESILSQTYSNLEILVVDDGSTDHCMGCVADIKDSRVRVIKQKNGGRAVALNQGLKYLSGVYYATHDADDISHPQRIQRQVCAMLKNPDLAAVFTGYDMILGECHVAPRFSGKNIQACRLDIEQIRMPTHDPTGMFRVEMVQEMRYEPTLRIGAGLDYILRVGEHYPMMVLGECLYSYRIHSGSITKRDPALREQMIRKVIKRACERRGLDLAEHLPSWPASIAKSLYKEQEAGIVPHFMESVLDLRRASRNWEALTTALACLQLHPYDLYYYKPLAYFLAPLALIRYYRSRKVKKMT